MIASIRRDAYSRDEVRFSRLVTDQIALAMDDTIHFRDSQRARERLELLLGLTNRLVSCRLATGPHGVNPYSHEVSGAYVFHVPLRRITPFALAGVGAPVFDPKDFAGASS